MILSSRLEPIWARDFLRYQPSATDKTQSRDPFGRWIDIAKAPANVGWRTFLSSPEELVKELRDMKVLDFKNGSDAYDKVNFERWRIAAIDELLRRFEPLAN